MTTNTDPVRALIETWRNAVKDFDERQNKTLNAEQREWLSGISEGIDRCADELEAALASAPPSAPVGVEGLPWELRRRATVVGAVTGVLLNRAADAIDALAQQPSAPSGEAVGDVSGCCDTPAFCSSVRRCTAKDAAPQQPAGVDGLANLAAAVRQHLRWRETGVSRVPSIAELREWAEAFDALAAQQQGGAK